MFNFLKKTDSALEGNSEQRFQFGANHERSFDFFGSCHRFVELQIKGQMQKLVDDILECYIFEDHQLDYAYVLDKFHTRKASLNIRDILINSFLGKEQKISKIKLLKNAASVELFVSKELKDDGTLDFGDFKNIVPIVTVCLENIFDDCTLEPLKSTFEMIWQIRLNQERHNKLNEKIIFKKSGFNALFIEPRNDEEYEICQQNRALLRRDVQSILNGQGGIIDSEDSMGVITSSSVENFIRQIEQAYSEISRILCIPLTRLLGRAPQGMNATGVSDGLNYDLTLDRYRSKWVEPFLIAMDIKFQKVAKIDINYLKQILDMYIACEGDVSRLREKIYALGDNL